MRSTGHAGHQGTAGRRRPGAAFPGLDARLPDHSTGRTDTGAGGYGCAAESVTPAEVGRPTGSLLTRAVGGPIRLYRALSANRLPHCRYWPTCSAYALESIETHGAGRGLALALRRIARCHPWGGFGFDPVPLRSSGSQVEA